PAPASSRTGPDCLSRPDTETVRRAVPPRYSGARQGREEKRMGTGRGRWPPGIVGGGRPEPHSGHRFAGLRTTPPAGSDNPIAAYWDLGVLVPTLYSSDSAPRIFSIIKALNDKAKKEAKETAKALADYAAGMLIGKLIGGTVDISIRASAGGGGRGKASGGR